jgi:hypothetical protein
MEWYSEVWEFQICLIFRILLLPTILLSRTDFSNLAIAQNSVTCKPLVRWKAGSVVQRFGIQLQGRICHTQFLGQN